MKKKLLAATVAAAMAGSLSVAQAAPQVNLDGIGQINVVPYFTSQENNFTLINIVNTDTVNGKAVKLRARGAEYSDDVFDITVFLSPGDVFAAGIIADSDGSSRFVLPQAETTCTWPSADAIRATPRFISARILRHATHDAAAARAGTREGYIEVINMADIPVPAGYAGLTRDQQLGTLYGQIKHVDGVAPCNLDQDSAVHGLLTQVTPDLAGFHDAPQAGAYLAAATTAGLAVPTANLMTNATVVDLARSSAYGFETLTIMNDPAGLGATRIIFSPQEDTAFTDIANLQNWWSADSFLAANTTGAISRAAYYDVPDLSTSLAEGVGPIVWRDLISAALQRRVVMNEWMGASGLSQQTDWVFAMPTRRYHMVPGSVTIGGNVVADQFQGGDGVFANLTGVHGNTAGNQAATTVRGNSVPLNNWEIWDRNEEMFSFTQPGNSIVISPSEPTDPAQLRLVGEVAVFSFNREGSPSGVFHAELTTTDWATGAFADGWMRVDLQGPGLQTTGLPAVGFAAMRFTNEMCGDGPACNYGAAWSHRYNTNW